MAQGDAQQLAQAVGLGIGGRGSVADAIEWAERARLAGVESIWIHDTPFERDAVTYASAIASHVPDIGVALGALNPFTRHPTLLAQTVSALDDMAPGRITLGLGTGLPLRLGQMGIPYTPDDGLDRVSTAIDVVRTMWAGERVSAPGTLPPIQPMFPPVHRVPIYIAAYRSAFMKLAGEKADGYLARPAESIPGLRRLLGTLRTASVAAGRGEDAVRVAGYLLTFLDQSRREALNRAKREPFVIYMMSVQSDAAYKQAGFNPELKTRIAGAWRAEDYHVAAEAMPDDLVDAFLLCGTVEEVAARMATYREAGMHLPIIQPIIQEREQVLLAIAAAVEYGRQTDARNRAIRVDEGVPTVTVERGSLPAPERVRRRLGAWFEIIRPFSLTASAVPVLTAGGLAALHQVFSWPLFLATLFGALLLQMGTNVVNEIYDVRKGIDVITSPRASRALLKGRLSEREAFAVAWACFGLSTTIGVWLILVRGWPVAVAGLVGLAGGIGYTAPPLQYKYRALGLPLVFLLMGPLMVGGAYYTIAGAFHPAALAASVPVGLLVAAILHGNEWRDIGDDARAGIRTFSISAGRRVAHVSYLWLVVGAYIVLGTIVALGILPPLSMLPVFSLPLLVRAIRASELGASGQQRAIAMIDLQTAQLHASFGFLLALGLAAASLVR